ncbi:hypothetical protein METBIDRAFT_44259 [Metschnikowia bicuspidata var. bicuspidata NRRL YB-4993]|uniref:Sister chromatid cohesion protein DCC1 n=1 Tax=Metschnikowia bicuspidata var. bicuspidata NRRL YB-4993 TaxID=869754 RepID=A0A1A0H9E3_9ASCO|nr:hypothetical protein METBIDRAFT_44259 [Metschnikowia bicuspidata var. bicuspidata NRRL YB-4993]OBA20507.1 hypothetical protein METBIDRAFT_44259 [Metschnikowia bicuspidata var. bicuspidata NRRL YB-4993]
MTFTVYNQLSHSNDYVYKLIQLPSELVEYMKNEPDKPLQFKAPTNVKTQLAICTDTTTYNVRQMNHSNTQLLMNDMAINKAGHTLAHTSMANPAMQLLGIGLASYIYELSEVAGYIQTGDLPVYEGISSDLLQATKSVADVRDDSTVAPKSFLSEWHALGGSTVDGKAVVLSSKLITEVLHTIISLMIAEDIESFKIEKMAVVVAEQNKLFTRDIVDTVASKFSTTKEDVYSLDTERVAKWFGIETLRNQKTAFTEKELLLAWKASLPPFYNASLDVKLLYGHFCRPSTDQIRYLRLESLSGNLHTRIKEMFQMVKEWEYDEFLPFVLSFVPASKKADSIILKYARKKRVGRKVFVCPR